MTQPPYGQGPDPYQNPQQAVGGGTPAPWRNVAKPVRSDYEAYGNTCGGRIDEADVDGRRCTNIF